MKAEHRHLRDLVRAWADGRTAPLPLPAGVTTEAITDCLRVHNAEAVLGSLLPASAREEAFVQQVNLSRSRSDFLLLEYERLLPILTAPGCQPVLLKGAALALGTYAEPTDRWFLDLDVLVPRPEVDGACERLEAAGYRHLEGKRDPLFYEKYHLHRIMLGPQGSVVEIHWDLTIPGSVYKHDAAGVLERAEICRLGRHEVACAAPADQILHGVYQHIADGFVDLRRILDQVQLLRRLTPAERNYLVAEAQRTGMARGLWLSLHMVKEIAEFDPGDDLLQPLAPGSATRRTLRGLHVAEGLLERRAARVEGYTQMLHILLTPTERLRCQEILRSLWVGEGALLDRGFRPGHLPGPAKRFLIWLRQVKVLGWVSFRTARALASG